MSVLQFRGKIAIGCYHKTLAHHPLELDNKLSVLRKAKKPGLDDNLIIEQAARGNDAQEDYGKRISR